MKQTGRRCFYHHLSVAMLYIAPFYYMLHFIFLLLNLFSFSFRRLVAINFGMLSLIFLTLTH